MAVGGWNCLEKLGGGGNAVVWKAECDGTVAALKVLNKTDVTSESYRRFRREVAVLRKLGSYPGILPILDAHVPEEPNKSNRAWLAMPLAIGIREALGVNPPLVQVVGAIRCIARTLGGLADQGISHRDIKPENLYHHEGQWVIGDFGLVDYPGKQAITVSGRALGPRFYLAPEMITDPVHADGRPVDVYSLAKTLWVLGAGQNYPPPGFQPASISQISLNMYVGHPHADILDRFIERATRHSPTGRPTMRMMADELDAWIEVGKGMSEVGRPMPFLPMLKKHLDEEAERLDSIRQRGEAIYEKEVKNHIEGFVGVLKGSGLSRLSDTIYHSIETDELLGRLHCISFETRGIKKYVMRIYLGLAVCRDLLTLKTKSLVELYAPSGENLFYWKEEQPVEIESSFVEQKLAGLANECADNIEAALSKLLECLKGIRVYLRIFWPVGPISENLELLVIPGFRDGTLGLRTTRTALSRHVWSQRPDLAIAPLRTQHYCTVRLHLSTLHFHL